MLPSLETDTYTQNVSKYDNIDLLETTSKVKNGLNGIEVVEYHPTSLISFFCSLLIMQLSYDDRKIFYCNLSLTKVLAPGVKEYFKNI